MVNKALNLLLPLAACLAATAQAGELPRVIGPDPAPAGVPATLARPIPALAAVAAPRPASAGQTAKLPGADLPGPGLRPALLATVQAEARAQGVPPELADAVAVVESGYTPSAIGTSGEIGLMQVMPGTAAMLGFAGPSQALAAPATNIHFGVAYLARAWLAAGGNPCRALMKYRAGVNQDAFSPLSLAYCHHAATWLAMTGSPLAQRVADTTPALATIADSGAAPAFGGHGAGFAAPLPGGRTGGAERISLARVQAAIDRVLQAGSSDPHFVRMPE